MPAFVAPEGFQAHQSLVPSTTPKLAGSFEAALVLPTGRFHGATALRLASSSRGSVIHPVLVLLEILHFAFHRSAFLLAKPPAQCSQITEQRRGTAGLELAQQGLDPLAPLSFILRIQRVGHRP